MYDKIALKDVGSYLKDTNQEIVDYYVIDNEFGKLSLIIVTNNNICLQVGSKINSPEAIEYKINKIIGE